MNAEQGRCLDRDGYVVVPAALDAEWVHRLRLAFADAHEQSHGTQHVTLTPEVPEHSAWEQLRDHPLACAAATRALAAPFTVTELHGRNPLPGYGLQGLHADAPPRQSGGFFVVTAIWMIDDFTPENGATRVVPGTHLLPGSVPKSLAQPSSRHRDEVLVTGCAGSVLLMNGHLWHSGRRNESTGYRRCAQMVLRAAVR